MRIDKFLKVSRLLKRRSVAQEACGADKILLNGCIFEIDEATGKTVSVEAIDKRE